MPIIHRSTDYADLFFEHLTALREYAERIFIQGDILDPDEDADRAEHANAFLNVGRKCEFTEHQLVFLVFDELLRV
ncbi:MAG: hypothetical protein IIC21_03310 [Chloroflexi bacterium]|nr:hypothetical protein [Chloroflexota bacterium]